VLAIYILVDLNSICS